MRGKKVYNLIFPIWFLKFIPPVIFVTLIGNFIIDSLIILIAFYVFQVFRHTQVPLRRFYGRSILLVWGFGFLADIVGTLPPFVSYMMASTLSIPHYEEILRSVGYNPFLNVWGFLILFFGIVIAGVLIYLLNDRITFRRLIQDRVVRAKVSATLAVVTAPWTLLLPTEWLYYGM